MASNLLCRGGGKGGGGNQRKMGADTLWTDSGKTKVEGVGRGKGWGQGGMAMDMGMKHQWDDL